MRGRIESQNEQRKLMLSGISHDLRTPLTRLRLGLSMMSPYPWHAVHGRDVNTWPRKLRCTCCVCPAPPHTSHVCLPVPGREPSP